MDHIHVFKTDIRTETELGVVGPVMDNHPAIEQWSVDIQDHDCVLRVISYELCPGDIIRLISRQGFQCIELL